MRHVSKILLAFGLAALASGWGFVSLGDAPIALAGDTPKPQDPPQPGMGDPAQPGMDPAAPGMDPAAPGMDPAPAPGMDPAQVPPVVPPTPAPPPVPIADGWTELQHLREHMGNRKADNADIIADIDAVMKAYKNPGPNAEPPADPAEAAKAKAAFDADVLKFKKEVEAALIKALEQVKVNAKTKSNERDDVNVRAATALGGTRASVTDDIIKSLENKILPAQGKEYESPSALFDEIFKAIGILGDVKTGYKYLGDTWLKYRNNKGEPEKVKSAFDAVILFRPHLKGSDRLAFVELQIRSFVGVEHSAETNKDKTNKANKEVWDKIKTSVVKAVQVMADEPKDEKGALPASMKAFNEWFGEHKNPRDDAWKDPPKDPPKKPDAPKKPDEPTKKPDDPKKP